MGITGAIIGGVGSLASSMFSSKKDSQAAGNYQQWAQMMKPTPAEKEAMRKRGMKRIEADFMGSKKELGNTMASRGLGGGQLKTGFADLTRAKDSAYGDLETQVELFGAGKAPNTPPPTEMSTGDYFLGNAGNMLSFLGGKSMGSGGGWGWGGGGSGSNSGWATNPTVFPF